MTDPMPDFWSYQRSGWLVALEHISPMATWPNKIRMHGPRGERAVGSRECEDAHHSPREQVGEPVNTCSVGAA